MAHLGDPCIHCQTQMADVAVGPCQNSGTLAAAVRASEYLKGLLARHLKESAATTAALKQQIAERETFLARSAGGLDPDIIKMAEGVLYVRGEFARAGEEKGGTLADAIKWFGTGKSGAYYDLRTGYFGTKSYDRWHGQRCDCEYGMGPSHGHIIFEIGLKGDARKRDLTDAEREACIYYLTNLARVQKTKVAA